MLSAQAVTMEDSSQWKIFRHLVDVSTHWTVVSDSAFTKIRRDVKQQLLKQFTNAEAFSVGKMVSLCQNINCR